MEYRKELQIPNQIEMQESPKVWDNMIVILHEGSSTMTGWHTRDTEILHRSSFSQYGTLQCGDEVASRILDMSKGQLNLRGQTLRLQDGRSYTKEEGSNIF
ncbi:unnamed protein product [Citrullus colocynthis]|uniref:Uncharacterized protein n=1 Tax=Citrullus colocynthis TaxID=252529 RepID=A0ABP0Y1D4_9ROSI